MRYGRLEALSCTTDAKGLLPTSVRPPSLLGLRVATPSLPHLLAPRLSAARLAAVALPTIAPPADLAACPTLPAVEYPQRLRRSLPPPGGLQDSRRCVMLLDANRLGAFVREARGVLATETGPGLRVFPDGSALLPAPRAAVQPAPPAPPGADRQENQIHRFHRGGEPDSGVDRRPRVRNHADLRAR